MIVGGVYWDPEEENPYKGYSAKIYQEKCPQFKAIDWRTKQIAGVKVTKYDFLSERVA
jgi:hypothetical protein